MNADCLGVIFSHLPFKQLMELSYMSDFFRDVFFDHLGSKVRYNSNDGPYTAAELLELFGKRIRQLTIVDHSDSANSKLEKYLRLIIAHCEKDILTELHLDLGKRGLKCDKHVIEESMAYFTNINKLTIETPNVFVDYDEFLVKLSTTARNIQSLQFECIYWKGSWSTLSAWTNLIELRINCNGKGNEFDSIDLNDFAILVRANPSLEVFDISSRQLLIPIFDLLAECCPNLRVYGDRYKTFENKNYGRFLGRYDNIQHFKNLREITLTCLSDHFFDIQCALSNASETLETLNIFTVQGVIDRDLEMGTRRYYYPSDNFNPPNLKVMRIISGNDGKLEFFFQIAREHNVRILHIGTTDNGSICSCDLSQVLDVAPQIKMLDIASILMYTNYSEERNDLGSEVVFLIDSIRLKHEISLPNIVKPSVHLIINDNQWRALKKIHDWKLFVTVEVR